MANQPVAFEIAGAVSIRVTEALTTVDPLGLPTAFAPPCEPSITGPRSSLDIGFRYIRRNMFREKVAGTQSVDAVEHSDYAGEADTGPEL
ncbi:hypothetical protein FN846DRAFT_905077 [Sphaerosporella brunnea]|uniref:Uncharacterized protein n=1 Tax=Sphaerosporella brunnea TaxID=1250544 RepID=A0A5J5F393_9PEZI|nr:hypothetical protein FN846DRAFT_905077 [Sphaerosporella brunnea]